MQSFKTFYESSESGLKKKAEKSGMPLGILRKVFNRGKAAWKSGHRPGTNPDQWGKVPSKPVLNALKYMRLQPEELFQKLRQMGYTVIISNSGIS